MPQRIYPPQKDQRLAQTAWRGLWGAPSLGLAAVGQPLLRRHENDPAAHADAVAKSRHWLLTTSEGQAIAARAQQELWGKESGLLVS